MDDLGTIQNIIAKSERPINKYYVEGGSNPGWCLRLESDDAQRELVLTFDQYGRLDKIDTRIFCRKSLSHFAPTAIPTLRRCFIVF